MDPENIDLILENEALKNEFVIRNLDLEQIFSTSQGDLQLENEHLRELLDWVDKYKMCPAREKMEADGYLFPPIEPRISPDNDWYLFERWIKGLPIRLRAFDQLDTPYTPKDPDELSDQEIMRELEFLEKALHEIRISVDLNKDVPPRMVYAYLMDTLNDEFGLMTEGSFHIDGCSGYCPECFQRPWCDTGNKSCWSEDEKIGEMFLIDSVRRYVSPSPVSLAVLRKCQAEEDKRFAEFE